jgi:hypothetical protein
MAEPIDQSEALRLSGVPEEVHSVLHAMNGFFLFDRAFHFRGAGEGERYSISEWNEHGRWKSEYNGGEPGQYFFFASDVFGNQFGTRSGEIFLWNAETCHAEHVAPSLDAFWEVLAFDTDFLTGQSLAVEWQSRHAALPLGSV